MHADPSDLDRPPSAPLSLAKALKLLALAKLNLIRLVIFYHLRNVLLLVIELGDAGYKYPYIIYIPVYSCAQCSIMLNTCLLTSFE